VVGEAVDEEEFALHEWVPFRLDRS
jgi:hypothetical protein